MKWFLTAKKKIARVICKIPQVSETTMRETQNKIK